MGTEGKDQENQPLTKEEELRAFENIYLKGMVVNTLLDMYAGGLRDHSSGNMMRFFEIIRGEKFGKMLEEFKAASGQDEKYRILDNFQKSVQSENTIDIPPADIQRIPDEKVS